MTHVGDPEQTTVGAVTSSCAEILLLDTPDYLYAFDWEMRWHGSG